ncbi:MAG: hypothetical protein A3K16_00955 [Omnitrophica bacterium RIFCSPLOWO2_01_FULL_45_24]|nr:MAG: hypothetical protein A3C51_03640 [Omnitrophica bacterium RIFCSPHIGHO2_02_FULL_46_20]OGW94889.1 MAG: hypothetical protein A3K16_00955 [Omnitrophica bacterium RIFCSPLOWO2_01_FULL_45_24]
MKSDKRGFTLIELIIAMVITGILAGITVVSMQNMTQRAIVAEGVAGLGRVRQAIREWYNIKGAYLAPASNTLATTALGTDYINTGELTATYFSESCYYVAAGGAVIWCYVQGPIGNSAPKAAITMRLSATPVTARISMFINDGTVKTYQIPNSGYPQQSDPSV